MEEEWDHHSMPWLAQGCLVWACEWCNSINTHTVHSTPYTVHIQYHTVAHFFLTLKRSNKSPLLRVSPLAQLFFLHFLWLLLSFTTNLLWDQMLTFHFLVVFCCICLYSCCSHHIFSGSRRSCFCQFWPETMRPAKRMKLKVCVFVCSRGPGGGRPWPNPPNSNSVSSKTERPSKK